MRIFLHSQVTFASYPFSCQQSANILTSKDFKLTLIDYGNARRMKSPKSQLVNAVGVTEFVGGYRE